MLVSFDKTGIIVILSGEKKRSHTSYFNRMFNMGIGSTGTGEWKRHKENPEVTQITTTESSYYP